MINIIFFGPPGAGKGTQAKEISKYLNLPHLSTGDILRNKINQKDSLALKLKEVMSSGKLVSDDILNQIVSEKLLSDSEKGFILDGYPRTLDQSVFLNKLLKKNNLSLNFIFNIDLELNLLTERILKRSKEEGREDDNIEAIQIRYNAYVETTKKVSDYYKANNREIFFEISGNQEIDQITSKIKKILKN